MNKSIVDNYSTYKAKEEKAYIESGDDRFVVHFIPTHASWLNMIERWLRKYRTNEFAGEAGNR
ncbi:MAG: transposase [Spirochaetaceae bacterium]|nr:transposase [Spirochaetaceae bacterium]